jgi:hypothetical protein
MWRDMIENGLFRHHRTVVKLDNKNGPLFPFRVRNADYRGDANVRI